MRLTRGELVAADGRAAVPGDDRAGGGLRRGGQRPARRGAGRPRTARASDAHAVSDGIHWCSSRAALGHVELVAGDLEAAIAHLRELPARQQRAGHFSPSVRPVGGHHRSPHRARASSTPRRSISIATENCRRSASHAPGSVRLAPRGCCTRRAVTRTQQSGSCRSRWMPRSPGSIAWSAGGRCWRSAPSSDKPSSAARRGRRSRRRRGSSTSLGAKPWAEKARTELGRISGRGAASDELTTLERRVAELAADGRRNKEIAAAMYVTVADGGGAPVARLPQARRPLAR